MKAKTLLICLVGLLVLIAASVVTSHSSEAAEYRKIKAEYDFDNDGAIDSITRYVYDATGNMTREEGDWNKDGMADSVTTFSYDANGNMTKKEVDFFNDGTMVWVTTYIYDANGNLIREEEDTNKDGIIDSVGTFTYDASGNRTREEWDLDNDGTISEIATLIYDANGNLIRDERDYDPDGIIDAIKVYTYDANGNRISTWWEDPPGTISEIWTYYYDANGNLTREEFMWNIGGLVESVIINTYELITAQAKMYWASYGKIQRANLDGTNVEELVTGEFSAEGIALDLEAGKIYWTVEWTPGLGGDWVEGVYRADLDGSNQEMLVSFDLGGPERIALDLANGKMYWPDWDRIQRADLDGTEVEDVVSGLSGANAIALDIANGKIYWTSWNWMSGFTGVQKSDLDGTNIEDVVTVPTLGFLEDIELDVAGNKMYLAADNDPRIWLASLDGSGLDSFPIPFTGPDESGADGIALDLAERKIYFTVEEGTISRGNLDGSNIEQLVSGLNMPGDIALLAIQPETPEEIIEEIAEDIGDMVSTGELNEGEGEALTSKLDVAKKKLYEGNSKAACNVLQAFINQTNAMIKSGRLSEEEGQALIEDTNSICM